MKPSDLEIPTQSTTDSWRLFEFDRELAIGIRWEEFEEALLSLPEILSPPNSIVTLLAPTGDSLSIGIAGPRDSDNPDLNEELASMEFNEASQDPPYLAVVGDPGLSLEEGGVVVFRFGGEWTEILRRNCVTPALMIRIVKDFFETNTLSKVAVWEQV